MSVIKKKTYSVFPVLFIISILLNIVFFSKQFFHKEETNEFFVHEVVDGDTIIAGVKKERMRLTNVEAPELQYCGGIEAKEKLKELIEGQNVKLVFVGEDYYNRSIVLVYLNNISINKELVKKGLVRYDGTSSPERDNMREAYQQAVREKLGIFGPPCRSESPDHSECIIKGNVNKNPIEKVYLFPVCSKYELTVVEKDLGEQWFCTEKEAQDAGFTKAANCK